MVCQIQRRVAVDRGINERNIGLCLGVLGENENLVTVYVRLQGPWKDPVARLVPPQSVRTAAGWAERMIGAGVSQLRKILSLPGTKPEPEPDDPPEEASEFARPG